MSLGIAHGVVREALSWASTGDVLGPGSATTGALGACPTPSEDGLLF
jgi:hypothetical protein